MTDVTAAIRRRPRTKLLGGLAGLACLTLLTGCFNAAPTQQASPGGDQRIALAMLQPPRSGLTPLSDDAFKLSRWATAETLIMLDAWCHGSPPDRSR